MKHLVTRILSALLLVGAMTTAALAHQTTQQASYAIRGMAFEGPDALPAGMTTLTVMNEAERDDMYALVSLDDGRTLDEFFSTMGAIFMGELLVIPRWIHFHGGSPIGIEDSRSYTIFLSPGTYYLLSIGADDEGPYAARGMVKPIVVSAPEPASNATITLDEYKFVIDGTLTAGMQTLRIHNIGKEPHEVLMMPLPEGVTLQQMLAGPPEGHDEHAAEPELPSGEVQGLWVIDPGATAYVTVNLQPGNYGLVCSVPDADGPHMMQGMALEVAVQ